MIPAPAEGQKQKSSPAVKFAADLMAGGVAGAISMTAVAPIERVKLLLQTQDSNPRIKSGEIARYTGIGNCFTRVSAEQGARLLRALDGASKSAQLAETILLACKQLKRMHAALLCVSHMHLQQECS